LLLDLRFQQGGKLFPHLRKETGSKKKREKRQKEPEQNSERPLALINQSDPDKKKKDMRTLVVVSVSYQTQEKERRMSKEWGDIIVQPSKQKGEVFADTHGRE